VIDLAGLLRLLALVVFVAAAVLAFGGFGGESLSRLLGLLAAGMALTVASGLIVTRAQP